MTIKNESGLKAVGRAVLCEPYDPEFNKTMIAIPDHVRSRELMAEMRATVVQLGANCWPDEPPRAAPGDRVLISRFCGAIVKSHRNGKLYRLCNDNDIFCQLDGDESIDEVIIEDPIVKTKRLARGA